MKGDPWTACKPFMQPSYIPNFYPILPHFSPFPPNLLHFPLICTHFPPFSPSSPHFSFGHRQYTQPPFWGSLSPFSHSVFQEQHIVTHFPPIPPYFPGFRIVFRQGSGNWNFWTLLLLIVRRLGVWKGCWDPFRK